MSSKRLQYEPSTSGTITPVQLDEPIRLKERYPDPRLSLKLAHSLENLSLEANRIIPLFKTRDRLEVLIDDPQNPALAHLAKQVGNVSYQLATSAQVNQLLGITGESEHHSNEDVMALMTEAVRCSASDIHINKTENGATVSYRTRGRLVPSFTLPTLSQTQAQMVTAYIKLHANLDISQTQLPQDGQISLKIDGKKIESRVSLIPTLYGEDIVCRFFKESEKIGFNALGFSSKAQSLLNMMLANKTGLILVTGPTGSGKSTTLYAALEVLKKENRGNIVTLEDPIEQYIPGIRQSQVNPAGGYTFAKGLRAILRQDPDIIMIGEIRDEETANIALDAAYTGHLVLATLHTQDCKATISRLVRLKCDPHLVAQTLRGIVSQRLVSREEDQCLISEIVAVASTPEGSSSESLMTHLVTKNPYISFEEDAAQKGV